MMVLAEIHTNKLIFWVLKYLGSRDKFKSWQVPGPMLTWWLAAPSEVQGPSLILMLSFLGRKVDA
jgi:uncharacterized membrane protein YphA (DoxX/SURF4 family)